MKLPLGAIFVHVTFTLRSKRRAEQYVSKCRAAGLSAHLDRERSRRGWHLVSVHLYRGEALP